MTATAVISAFNPLNCGMYSVDLAAEQFFGELQLPVTHLVSQERLRTGRLRFRLLRSPAELAAYDNIVYWGDFLNNPMWGERDYVPRELKHGWSRSADAAREQWRMLYLEARHHAPRARIFAIGGCFLGADAATARPLGDGLRGFLDSAALVTPRDGRSLDIVRAMAPDARIEEGMDCAWLLAPPPAGRARGPGYFACFLGRTLEAGDRGFLDELGHRTGLKPVWLDWLRLGKSPWLADRRFRRMRRLLAGARFVVTDTYHLSINALNCATPVVCLFDGSRQVQDGTLGDYKKLALMEQLGLADWLLEVGDGRDLAPRIAGRLEALSEVGIDGALAAFSGRRERYRQRLREAFGGTPGTRPTGRP